MSELRISDDLINIAFYTKNIVTFPRIALYSFLEVGFRTLRSKFQVGGVKDHVQIGFLQIHVCSPVAHRGRPGLGRGRDQQRHQRQRQP